MRARHMLMPRKDSALWVKHVSHVYIQQPWFSCFHIRTMALCFTVGRSLADLNSGCGKRALASLTSGNI